MTRATINEQPYTTRIEHEDFTYKADEPISVGGAHEGPTPMQYLLGSLAGCTAITLRMYADRKGWEIGDIRVDISMKRERIDGYLQTTFEKKLQYGNPDLDSSQLKRLDQISKKCPVAKVITGDARIV
jgi:putative redox protein